MKNLLPALKRVLLAYLAVELTGTLLVLPWLIGGLAGVDAIYLTHNRFVVLVVLVVGIVGGYGLAIPAMKGSTRLFKRSVGWKQW